MGRVANDDHVSLVPRWHVRQVVSVVAGKLELTSLDEVECRAAIFGEELHELAFPVLSARRGTFSRGDLRARHIGEPDCVA